MKARYGLAIGLTVAFIGCDVSTTTNVSPPGPTYVTPTDAGPTLSQAELAAMTLVKLKLPHMT